MWCQSRPSENRFIYVTFGAVYKKNNFGIQYRIFFVIKFLTLSWQFYQNVVILCLTLDFYHSLVVRISIITPVKHCVNLYVCVRVVIRKKCRRSNQFKEKHTQWNSRYRIISFSLFVFPMCKRPRFHYNIGKFCSTFRLSYNVEFCFLFYYC